MIAAPPRPARGHLPASWLAVCALHRLLQLAPALEGTRAAAAKES